jgi:hypothetical protein
MAQLRTAALHMSSFVRRSHLNCDEKQETCSMSLMPSDKSRRMEENDDGREIRGEKDGDLILSNQSVDPCN